MSVSAPTQTKNYYAGFMGYPLAARKVGGELHGPLVAMAAYCLRSCNRTVGQISDERLTEMFLKQRPGLLSEPDPRFLRVHLKPFRSWLLRNIERLTMSQKELADERWKHELAIIRSYQKFGPHFHWP